MSLTRFSSLYFPDFSPSSDRLQIRSTPDSLSTEQVTLTQLCVTGQEGIRHYVISLDASTNTTKQKYGYRVQTLNFQDEIENYLLGRKQRHLCFTVLMNNVNNDNVLKLLSLVRIKMLSSIFNIENFLQFLGLNNFLLEKMD